MGLTGYQILIVLRDSINVRILYNKSVTYSITMLSTHLISHLHNYTSPQSKYNTNICNYHQQLIKTNILYFVTYVILVFSAS